MPTLLGGLLMAALELPMGPAPEPVLFSHFPNTLSCYVWRNWELVPTERIAEVVGASPGQILELGHAMGLEDPPPVTEDQWRRSFLTIIRRNWHLLPYDQLLELLDWSAEELAFTLREDDFFFVKLGLLKPKCPPLTYSEPDAGVRERLAEIASQVREAFPEGLGPGREALFQFVRDLSTPPDSPREEPRKSLFSPRYCYSYFALYGDPLADTALDPFPEGLLARLAGAGVEGVWLQAVLYKLAPFPWQPELSEGREARLAGLRRLVAKAAKQGLKVYLYLNEPRAMPRSFFNDHPDLKGVEELDHGTLCTSVPEVREYLTLAIESICREVPDLGGFFTITASENLTNCCSHYQHASCPRCSKRSPEETVSELITAFREGIRRADSSAMLIAWDWGWKDEWAEGLIGGLPEGVALMSVSEWSLPIRRGGVATTVGEYSISAIGPGPRAARNWGLARKRGLATLAKIQAGTTWEIGSVPYIPALANVAQHAKNLRSAGVDGIQLGWTLGGYPSPNLEVVAEMGRLGEDPSVEEVLARVAERRFGSGLTPAVVDFWKEFSAAFSEFPYSGATVYNAPVHVGPTNLLWEKPTGYAATMVGMPYDNLDGWRGPYPEEAFIGQFDKMANGFEEAIAKLESAAKGVSLREGEKRNLEGELSVARACANHYRSAANQSRFVVLRRALKGEAEEPARKQLKEELRAVLLSEIELARSEYRLQRNDSRIGFEASNQYFYVPLDSAEKVINCRHLLRRLEEGQ
ncbi:MAG: hypothetical protein HUU16_03655 [Candidatus Omnitrophica bacterium]|nr:hypothetical protein [Candidatus Omnitrophota bacterium]